jgi:hypothetical protein
MVKDQQKAHNFQLPVQQLQVHERKTHQAVKEIQLGRTERFSLL